MSHPEFLTHLSYHTILYMASPSSWKCFSCICLHRAIDSALQVYIRTVYFMSVLRKAVDRDPPSPFVSIPEPETYFLVIPRSGGSWGAVSTRVTVCLFHVINGSMKGILPLSVAAQGRSWSPFIWLHCQRCVMLKDFVHDILIKVPL